VTIFSEHPIAHAQNEVMMTTNFDFVKSLQERWTEVMLNVTKDSKLKEILRNNHIEIANIIAFDGSPQFFPSESGGHNVEIKNAGTEADFIKKGGYPGWKPEYGTKCVGPLPPTSNLTKVNNIAKAAYEKNGLDMRWYGRTWEFINMFWFQTKGWGRGGLDCTHGGPSHAGMSCMHKYFLMAMVDDHFDNKEL
jgi:hypothetical protein